MTDAFSFQLDWIAQRDEGIRRAQVHAERVEPDWNAIAYGMLQEFCKARAGCLFTSEDVRRWCELHDFYSPVPKAFGGIFRRAARAGLIRKHGFGIAKQRHGSPTVLWEVA